MMQREHVLVEPTVKVVLWHDPDMIDIEMPHRAFDILTGERTKQPRIHGQGEDVELVFLLEDVE